MCPVGDELSTNDSPPASAAFGPDVARVKVLLVDDHPEQLLVLETILAELGQELVRAQSGREALRQCLNHDFALILMDVNMPGMDGFEAASLIRSRPRSRQTPIIFVTPTTKQRRMSRMATRSVRWITSTPRCCPRCSWPRPRSS